MDKTDSKINILHSFRLLFIYWNILGFFTDYNKYLIRGYDLFVTCIASIGFPAHLILGTIFAKDRKDKLINTTIAISSFACTLKHFLLRPHLDKMLYVKGVLQQLDDRVKSDEDTHFYINYIQKRSIFMTNCFTVIYFTVFFTAIVTALWTGNILYPAFVIIDWRNSTWKYWLIIVYQLYGMNMQLIQELTNDVYGPVVICILSGHVHLLASRVSRIGYDEKEAKVEGNLKDLLICIEDYKLLLSTTRVVERIISHSYMVQFMAVGINVVVSLIYLPFYADNILSYFYYIFDIVAMMSELFPCCYYGSMIQAEFHALSYAIFRSNWFTQPRLFRRTVVTFVELTLQDVTISAGGMMRIHLDSFFKTAKMGYSLFAIMRNVK